MNAILRFLLPLLLSGLLVSCQFKDPATPGLLVPRTVDEDPTLPFIAVNGTRLHAETFGNPADPLLIQLHGGPGADYATHLQAKAFAQEGYFVIFFDQRGAGLSRRHGPDSFTLENYFEDLRQIIAHYRYSPDQKVFLMGHSWGAMYATGYANRYPDAVNGLVLSEPGGFTLAEMQAYLGRAFAVKPFTEGINDIVWAEQLIAGKSHAELDYEFMLLAVTGSNVGDDGPLPISRVGAVCSQSMLALADRDGLDLASQLSAFQTKVLFMYSDQNMAYGYDHALRVSSAFPNVDLLEITGTGHDLHFFAFDAYFAASLTYLNALR